MHLRHSDPLGHLRTLLHEAPSWATWEALVEHINHAVPPSQREPALDYAHHHLKPWPDKLRVARVRDLGAWLDRPPPPAWPLVRSFALAGWSPDVGHVPRLAASGRLRHIRRLSLRDNPIPPETLEALLSAPELGRLQWLDLDATHQRPDGAALIAQAKHLTQLTHLFISQNRIGDAGAETLATARHLRTLEELTLGNNRLGNPAARALGWAPSLIRLQRLDLHGNAIDDDGIGALLCGGGMMKLRALYIKGNPLDAERLRALAARERPQLRVINADAPTPPQPEAPVSASTWRSRWRAGAGPRLPALPALPPGPPRGREDR